VSIFFLIILSNEESKIEVKFYTSSDNLSKISASVLLLRSSQAINEATFLAGNSYELDNIV
jgi:hypothetical protein